MKYNSVRLPTRQRNVRNWSHSRNQEFIKFWYLL